MKKSSEKLTKAITLVDRISNLPDELLLHILSFLKTKQAVTTSFLSKRWEFLWTYVDILELFDFKFRTKEQYMQFVRRVLEFHRAPLTKRMQIMFLGLYPTNDEVTLIQTVLLSKKVQSLCLCFLIPQRRKWPLCFFFSNTLVELKLAEADITKIMKSPTAPFFPNLKKLDLFEVKVNTNSINRFIAGCPILEDFSLHCDGEDFSKKGCCISSATLKNLEIHSETKIALNTPALEVLRIFENLSLEELVIESSMPCLHEVHISMTLSMVDDFRFLKIFSNVSVLSFEILEYSEDFDFTLSEKQIKKICALSVPFHNLTKLDIIAPWDYLHLLRFFMENSNNLQVITLKKNETSKDSNKVIWKKPQQVPICLLSSLRTICIEDYGNQEVDLVIKYVLENAQVLENMKIHHTEYDMTHYKVNLSNFDKKISKFRRASEICKLSFV